MVIVIVVGPDSRIDSRVPSRSDGVTRVYEKIFVCCSDIQLLFEEKVRNAASTDAVVAEPAQLDCYGIREFEYFVVLWRFHGLDKREEFWIVSFVLCTYKRTC